MKKVFKFGAMSLAALLVFGAAGCGKISDEEGKKWAEENGYVKETTPAALPASVNPDNNNGACDTDNLTAKYNTACSGVNAENLYQYMGRDDVVYIDARGSVASTKPGLYSEGHLKGFKNVEWFEYIHGDGKQLFYTDNGVFVPRYVDSVETLKDLFPQDKVLFIMCESGGRVVNVMKLLNQYGWDMSKVYNVGGWSQYSGDEYEEYRVNATESYEYEVKVGSWEDTVYNTTKEVEVTVLLNKKGWIVDKVYISGGTYATDEHKAEVDAELETLLNSFVGLDVDQIRDAADNYTTGGDDVITGATHSTSLIYKAVLDAIDGIIIE